MSGRDPQQMWQHLVAAFNVPGHLIHVVQQQFFDLKLKIIFSFIFNINFINRLGYIQEQTNSGLSSAVVSWGRFTSTTYLQQF